MAMCVFFIVVWTLNTIPEDMDNTPEKVDTFLVDHDSFSRMKPKWYISEDAMLACDTNEEIKHNQEEEL